MKKQFCKKMSLLLLVVGFIMGTGIAMEESQKTSPLYPFSRDETMFASFVGRTVELINLRTRKKVLLKDLLGKTHSGKISYIAFNRNSTSIITSSEDDNNTKMWNVATGELIRTIDASTSPSTSSLP